MNKQTIKTFWLGAVSMLSTLCLCALVIVTASGDYLSVAALDGTSSTTSTVHCFTTTTQSVPTTSTVHCFTTTTQGAPTTTAVHCYATQLDYDALPMHVGETRAIRFYHPVSDTATAGRLSEISPLLSVSYEEGSDTVYVTALAPGAASLYIMADGCAFGAYVYLTVESALSTTTTKWYQATSSPSSYPAPEDVNFDGFINMMDVLQLYANVSTGEGSMTWGGPLGDMNDDYVVNMMDVLLLYARISGGGMTYD